MNQAVSFLLLAGGGMLLASALTGNSLAELAQGKLGTVSNTGSTSSPISTVGSIASGALSNAGSAIAGAVSKIQVPSTSSVPVKVAAMQGMAELLNGLPYLWGGGHSGWSISTLGYDCSGLVSAVLHAAGYLSAPQTTQTLPGQPGIQSGPGQYVTIYDNTDSGQGNDHVIINLAGQWWESGGTATAGVHQIPAPDSSYLAQFNQILHPQGM